METATRIEVDCSTGVQTVHELTADEIADMAASAEQAAAERVSAEAAAVVKADAKTELLAKLGISAEEAALLLS